MRLFLAIAFLLAPASALRCGVVGAPVVARAASPVMALPKFEDAKNLSEEELMQEIFNAKKVRAAQSAGTTGRARRVRAAAQWVARPLSARTPAGRRPLNPGPLFAGALHDA